MVILMPVEIQLKNTVRAIVPLLLILVKQKPMLIALAFVFISN